MIGCTLPFRLSLDETLDCDEDTGAPVCEDHAMPYRFTGGLKKAVIDLSPRNLSATDVHQITTAKLAVDRQIKQREVADASFNLEAHADATDMHRPEWKLGAR